ncbi:5145_t:CDS:1 [Cetraspora pellucida]|uniref:5145_t:CDS:1 n=1 Tax=Cetraspora pellucida TaxID=1433469 RepID=A0ACA9NF04_9GLOM|nr:5145_t:CDS:1 [Cetraspora pellucida]
MAILEIIEALSITDYLLIFALIFATYVFDFYSKYLTRPNPLDGPFPLPFIGNLHNMFYDVRPFYCKCRPNYGNVCKIMVDGSRCIILSRPEYIEKLMSTCARRLPYYQDLDEIGSSRYEIAGNDVYES